MNPPAPVTTIVVFAAEAMLLFSQIKVTVDKIKIKAAPCDAVGSKSMGTDQLRSCFLSAPPARQVEASQFWNAI